EKGISTGSHSIPALALPPQECTHRILHIHKNVPGVLSEINTQLSNHKINILGQYLKTNESIGYVVLDVNKNLSKNALDLVRSVQATITVRVLYYPLSHLLWAGVTPANKEVSGRCPHRPQLQNCRS